MALIVRFTKVGYYLWDERKSSRKIYVDARSPSVPYTSCFPRELQSIDVCDKRGVCFFEGFLSDLLLG